MHFQLHSVALLLVLIGITWAEPPSQNYMYSNYDDYRRQGGGGRGHGKGRPSHSNDGYESVDASEDGGHDGGHGGGGGGSYGKEAAPQGDDYGYNELSPEKPYSGPHDTMTHSYSPPNNYEHGAGYSTGPRPGPYRGGGIPIRIRMPSIMKNLFRSRRPQKVYVHSSPSYSPGYGAPPMMVHSYSPPHSPPQPSYGGHAHSSGPSSYGPPSASSSESSYGGGSSGPYGGSPYERPSYEGGQYRPAKGHSAPENLYGHYPVKGHPKGYGGSVKAPGRSHGPPPVANVYGIASKGHSSPAIANAYGAVGKGYIAPTSSYGPPKGHRQRYSQPTEYESGYDTPNRNAGHDYSQQDVYGGGYDMGSSHY